MSGNPVEFSSARNCSVMPCEPSGATRLTAPSTVEFRMAELSHGSGAEASGNATIQASASTATA